MTIMMIALAVLFMLFLFSCLRMTNLTGGEGTRQSKGIGRQPDRPDEEDLKLYFRYRDEGYPADPTLEIPEWHYINRLESFSYSAEKEYQNELKRREQDRQHQDYLDWVTANNQS